MSKTMIQYAKAKRAPLRPATNGMLVGVNVFEPPYLASHTNVIAMCVTLGIQVIRAGITRSNMQSTVGGAIDWTEYDSIYAKCVAAGITLILAIETTPAKYNTQPHGYFTSPSPPTTDPSIYAIPLVTDPTYYPLWVADQADWAGQVAARYPLALLECWNEAFTAGSGYWLENNSSANKPTISAYATLYNAMQTSVHAANPGSTLAIAGLTALTTWFGTNGTYGLEVIRQLIQTYGVTPDVVSIHPYTGSATDPNPRLDHYGPNNTSPFANSFDDVRRVQSLLVRMGKGSIPLWCSEWGNWSAAAVGGESVKADYLTYTLNRLDKVCGYGAVGPTGAPVTIATFYPMIDASTSPTDTGLVGPAGNGPYTIHASGTAFQSWMSTRAAVTHRVSKVVLVADSSVVVTHTTAVPTVTVLDQFGLPMAGQTVTFTSGTPANATVASNGVATGVAAGTSNLKATCAGVDSNIVVLTVTAQVVTTVNVSPSSFTLASGNTQALTAASLDQLGSVMSDTFTWGSSNAGQATVDGTGLVTGVAAGSPTITATSVTAPAKSGTSAATITSGTSFDTTSYNASTGAGIGGSNGAVPITKAWDAANKYAADSNFRGQIANFSSGGRPTWVYSNSSLNGTGTYNSTESLSARYDDGQYVDLAVWQNSVQYSSQPAIAVTIVGANQAASAPSPILRTRVPQNVVKNTWLWRRTRFQSWTNVGDADNTNGGATFNGTQNAALKITPWIDYPTSRGGLTTGNGSGTQADLFVENAASLTETNIGYRIINEFNSAGDWYDWLVLAQQITGANGHTWDLCTVWNRKQGDAHFTRRGIRASADTGGSSFLYASAFTGLTSENYNQSRKTDLTFHVWGWGAWDADNPNADGSDDPFGVLAYEATLQPENPGINLTKTAQNSTSATFSVTVNRFTGYLRPIIDGTAQPSLDLAVPAEFQDGSTLTGLIVPLGSGTHTVKFRAMSGDKSQSSASDTNTVSGIVIP